MPAVFTKRSGLPSVLKAAVTVTVYSSCTHVYYAPNTAHAPLLSAKGETHISALYSTGALSNITGGELQAAYALNNRVGVMMNYFSAGKKETMSDGFTSALSHLEKGCGTYVEAACGYFNGFDAKKKWIAELYAGFGFGFGSVVNDYGYGNRSCVAISKYFLQPAIGFKTKAAEFAFVPKVCYINWKVKEAAISSSFVWPIFDELKSIKEHPDFMAFEPAFLVRFGAKSVKFQTGLSFSNFSRGRLFWAGSLCENFTGSIGVAVRLLPRKK